jgi:plasmid stabilization system protein ParE
MVFNLLIDFRAHQDIDEAMEYYISKNPLVALKLYQRIQDAYAALESNPFFEIRYLDYRCLPVKDFPYMFHFSVDERKGIVRIHAFINTFRKPGDNWLTENL